VAALSLCFRIYLVSACFDRNRSYTGDTTVPNRTPQSWELYREAQWRNRKEVRKASKDVWRTFCSSVSDLPMSARLHRALSRNPKIKLASLVAPSGRHTHSKRETLAPHFPKSIITEETVTPAAACHARVVVGG
jgi:hypothetical protein